MLLLVAIAISGAPRAASPASVWLRSSSPGACGITERNDTGGGCNAQDKGSWQVPSLLRAWRPAITWCLAKCAGCRRCAFVSISVQAKDCSWFASCGGTRLQVHGFKTGRAVALGNSTGMLQGGCGDTQRSDGVADPHGCKRTGSFGIPRGMASNSAQAAEWCYLRCERLEGCNFISISVSQQDCSWYRHCRLDRLKQNPVVTDIVSASARQRSAAAEALAKARCRVDKEGSSHKRVRMLNASSLNHAILSYGSRWPHLVSRLRSGAPVAMGVIGASVAQNAGCLTQPGKRCMHMSGQTRSTRTGWAVRMLQKINQSYPHHGHRIHNAAADATSADSMLKCLSTHLPPQLDLVIIEFGSMAPFMKPELASIEGMVRSLLASYPLSEIVILSVHQWCEQSDAGDPLFYRDGEQLGVLAGSPWERVEQETLRVCRAYQVIGRF